MWSTGQNRSKIGELLPEFGVWQIIGAFYATGQIRSKMGELEQTMVYKLVRVGVEEWEGYRWTGNRRGWCLEWVFWLEAGNGVDGGFTYVIKEGKWYV